MKRHSKETLEKKPHLRGQDLAITRAACAKFKNIPVTIVNYLEGTRFAREKHEKQQSPYQYLLRPKAGGVAFALATLGEQLDAILDVTIVYPGDHAPGFWQLISGQVSYVLIDIQTRSLDPALCQGDYENDETFQLFVRQWVSKLWEDKDQRIARLKAELAGDRDISMDDTQPD